MTVFPSHLRVPVGLVPCVSLAVSCFLFLPSAAGSIQIQVDLAHPAHDVPKTLYGIFFEDLNSAADGGLYAELIANRGFDWPSAGNARRTGWPDPAQDAWSADNRGEAMARLSRQYGSPVHEATAAHLRIECLAAGEGCGVRNPGYDGIAVTAGAKYALSFYARALDYRGTLRVLLEDSTNGLLASYSVKLNSDSFNTLTNVRDDDGSMRVGAGRVSIEKGRASGPARAALSQRSGSGALGASSELNWTRLVSVLVPSRSARDAHLSILLDVPGTVELDQVSLFPQATFNNRKNGLRADLVERLRALKPGIMRFPGGCLTEGQNWDEWYDWKRSVGDGSVESRPTVWNAWRYWQSRGLGFFEYFCLCEDLGCEPVPCIGSGIICQNVRDPYVTAPISALGYFASNACDLIEFANGDVSTTWGALRAKMGHPKPFNMKYLGIGNENWMEPFLDRYLVIQKIVKARHPEIRIISSAGPWPDGKEYDLAWKTLNPSNADVVDEHMYKSPEWMLANATRYDRYDRKGSKVFVGEFACHCDKRANNLRSALCEAAFMTGVERNSDVVEMFAYAPLFAKVGHVGWRPDLIWFDNVSSFVTPNYHVQRMFAANRPDRVVSASLTDVPLENNLPSAFVAAGLEDASGDLILKLVNVSTNALPVLCEFGAALPAQSVRRETLSGWPLAQNSFRHPDAIAPVADAFAFPGGKSWKGTLPASSLTVLRLKTND